MFFYFIVILILILNFLNLNLNIPQNMNLALSNFRTSIYQNYYKCNNYQSNDRDDNPHYLRDTHIIRTNEI